MVLHHTRYTYYTQRKRVKGRERGSVSTPQYGRTHDKEVVLYIFLYNFSHIKAFCAWAWMVGWLYRK
jgi:hypothetical protein